MLTCLFWLNAWVNKILVKGFSTEKKKKKKTLSKWVLIKRIGKHQPPFHSFIHLGKLSFLEIHTQKIL